jgi:hypothetical protein
MLIIDRSKPQRSLRTMRFLDSTGLDSCISTATEVGECKLFPPQVLGKE